MYVGATFSLVLFYTSFSVATNTQDFNAAVQELTNTCMDARNHKTVPGPEDSLHAQCSPWANRSCCSVQTSVAVHSQRMYNFDWSHCSQVKTISSKCRKHFMQDLCFYECSPNVGPWLVKVEQKIRKQRFINVPLCRSDCEAWFKDCLDDYTCTDNWGSSFDWKNGRNECPVGSTCMTFKSVYRNNATYFCETLWDYSWKVVDDTEACMRLWFDPENGNPNDAVALWKAKQIVTNDMTKSSCAIANANISIGYVVLLITIWRLGSSF